MYDKKKPSFILLLIKSCIIFFNKNYAYRASALAFASILALVPLLLVIFYIIAIFPSFSHIISLGQNYIVNNFVPNSALSLENHLHNFINQARKLPLSSIFFLFISTIMLVYTIEETFNDIWQVETRIRKKRFFSVLLYWLVFLCIPFLIGISVFISSYLFSLSWVSSATSALGVKKFFLSCLPIIINTLIFSLIYTLIPTNLIRWRDGLVGGLTAALLFQLAKIAFAYYLSRFPSYALIYGAFAVIPIFLLWMYIFWSIILFGAILTCVYITSCKKNNSNI